ncbi:hypothetical protein PFISCL1PPCAC_18509, partial [Pristionchus fissidentatus]
LASVIKRICKFVLHPTKKETYAITLINIASFVFCFLFFFLMKTFLPDAYANFKKVEDLYDSVSTIHGILSVLSVRSLLATVFSDDDEEKHGTGKKAIVGHGVHLGGGHCRRRSHYWIGSDPRSGLRNRPTLSNHCSCCPGREGEEGEEECGVYA